MEMQRVMIGAVTSVLDWALTASLQRLKFDRHSWGSNPDHRHLGIQQIRGPRGRGVCLWTCKLWNDFESGPTHHLKTQLPYWTLSIN